MARIPRSLPNLIALLKHRHAILMAARPEKAPGVFKRKSNRAGQTIFVDPDHVEGTSARGYGNGRIARIMMNAELVAAGEERIVIPTIYRSTYLSGLKALSNTGHATAPIRSLDFAQRWTAAVPWQDLERTSAVIDRCNAFMDAAEADDRGIRFSLPEADAI